LQDFLGTGFTATPLKPMSLRLRNALKPWPIRQPQRAMSYRIEASDGRRLKLLRFGRSMAERHAVLEQRLRRLASLDCIPTLVWSDEASLVTEWVEGEAPSVEDPHFARRLAEIFAELYRADLEERSRDAIVSDLIDSTDSLFAGSRLPIACRQRLETRLTSELPERIPSSTLCGDQTLDNFILAADGTLSIIDPGSLQERLPIDIFLVESGGLYERIDRDAFHESYSHAGGIEFLFTAAEPLRLFQLARHCALQLGVLETTPRFEARRRRNLERSAGLKLDQLRSELR